MSAKDECYYVQIVKDFYLCFTYLNILTRNNKTTKTTTLCDKYFEISLLVAYCCLAIISLFMNKFLHSDF